MNYDESDFYIRTKATWKGCNRPARKPDYISLTRRGEISSEYWYSEEGVIRCSQHWSHIRSKNLKYDYYLITKEINRNRRENGLFNCTQVADCFWVLKTNRDTWCGFCPWSKFKDNKGYRPRYPD